jgi:putative DNA primase/helicase
MAVARLFVKKYHVTGDGTQLLRHHRGDFYRYDGRCWPEAEERKIRAELYRWLEPAVYWKPSRLGPILAPFEPTRYKVANVLEALQAIGHLDADVSAPAWLEDGLQVEAPEYVALDNGLLRLHDRTLIPHTPAFFSQHALPFAYDPDAPTPARWHKFLDELWGSDREQADVLGEIFGYILGGGTSQQKLFLIHGPKRSGKGTIARVMTGLLGQHNVAAPTLASLTSNFGLSPLIGRPLAVVSDARLSTKADSLIAVERLLSISGEDTLTIDRKYRDPWTGRLPTRFLILSNELPRLRDSSGALAGRFVLLTLRRSFYDMEDVTLTDTLLGEAPGIFNWALAGLDRLLERGHFVRPAASEDAIRQLEDLGSPISAFVRDRCEVGADHSLDKQVLYAAWKSWCDDTGQRPGSAAVFGRDLLAAVSIVGASRPRDGDERRNVYLGIRLKP